jgi:N-acetylglucosamine transport system permease protein
MVNDELFWNALKHNLGYLVFLPILTIGLSLFLAFMISQRIRGSKFFRVTFFFPQVISIISIGVLFSYIYHPGGITSFLDFLGTGTTHELFNPPCSVRDADIQLDPVVFWASRKHPRIAVLKRDDRA